MPHTGVKPAKHTRVDTDLQVNVRGVHGFQCYCACGFEGPIQKTWGEAQFDARLHRGWHKMQERGL